MTNTISDLSIGIKVLVSDLQDRQKWYLPISFQQVLPYQCWVERSFRQSWT